ncbi:hypothetical protein [Halopenitus persicus]|uniref:Uncharacterized protein n=1 Tax=Halopenitus persicus TaxID=1048396 RepID=A0A1H3LZ23_9EURY|nr:hypothetical protein SAMN05216564_10866 [Halopenitus persicus]
MLAAIAGTGTGGLAGCGAFERGDDGETTATDDDEWARSVAERFAPTLYFDVHERWFPTDPRPYTREEEGTTIVDGFDALDGYHRRYEESEEPPNPTMFYHVREYADSPLAVVQFWYYAAFDQFTTNFHWHDWEVLHVFVDTDTEDPQLYVASSHSRAVPNNEFLDPDPERTPRILSELGSHSSALSVNEIPDRFQRLSTDGLLADITNTAIEGIEDLAEVPLAYGLPRDEGSVLPYVVPEYEGAPIHEHEDLPSVDRESLIDDVLTIRSLEAIQEPPADLPERETGLVFGYGGSTDGGGTDGGGTDGGDTDGGGTDGGGTAGGSTDNGGTDDGTGSIDVEYDLVPTAEIEHIDDFVGPQLSFEFAVPETIEDAVAGHISTTGTPWSQPRYENPAADVTVPFHRQALADRYDAIGDAAPINTVLTRVTSTIADDDAPENDGVTTTESAVESVALLESDPVAVPTFAGVAAVHDVPEGDHRLTVNGAGQAPHSERVTVEGSGSTTTAGVEGEIPLVARERARRISVSDEAADVELSRVALEDDFGGRLYDSAVEGSDAVYVHDGGAYTVEFRDADDAVGASRVNPDPAAESAIRIDRPETGTASLAAFVGDIADETRAEIAAVEDERDDEGDGDTDADETDADGTPTDGGTENAGGGSSGTDRDGSENAVVGLRRSLEAIAESARAAAAASRAGNRRAAEQRLEAVRDRLERAVERLEAAGDGVPAPLSRATRRRLDQASRRAEQARNSRKP